MMEIFTFLFDAEPFIPLIIIMLFGIKGFYFLKNKTASWRLTHFIYFDQEHINGSNSINSQVAKRIQNTLSQLIVLLAALKLIITIASIIFDLSNTY